MLLDLSTLSASTRRLVQDAGYRAALTNDLLRSDPSSMASIRARDAIDVAVVEILAAVGLPRGPINGPVLEYSGRSWFGRKAPDCTLSIDMGAFLLLSEDDRPDSLLRTWIHESLHARQPYSPGFHAEWRESLGYEEGMVEGLSRLIAIDWLGLHPIAASYDFYVASYRTLSVVLGADPEQLWRLLWSYPAGNVGARLPSAIERILREQGRAPMNRTQQARFSMFSARHFATGRANDPPDERSLVLAWRSAVE